MGSLSPGTVKDLIGRYNFRIKKTLGQNFLVDGNIIKKIIETAGLKPGDVVVEIGPGLGSLTCEMAEKARRVIAVEIDRSLFPILEETIGSLNNVSLVEADALKTDFDRLVFDAVREPAVYKVVANLPYYITTPLIMHLLEKRFSISRMVIMVQEEVARRLTARPGTREYGSLTVAANYYARVETAFRVPRTVFIPRPEVDSAVVSLEVRDQPAVSVLNEEHFFALVRAAFQQRRKTLINALSGMRDRVPKEKWSEILRQAAIDPARRGETLDLREFALLANLYTQTS
ncbi:16S rRNA (adenine(1518)-N(6)/adenine(1519)-N(6))-dimethyltransferase RsmA [Desulfallas sp. Bu1-1]|jgi:16S rRNA (adenine1518-N6/adenine1519-N6)-dimethyltransferase|uniref:16S rRNA (adenine(1518)-N(6)/adenine(1519)-N(6))- dimethyltransferase RsmA n=1 Tax=Desulfallas sp. Bu1-1 TaxID=2787620 RepID=UPI00189E6148|nr:16S rRNA (adenine(1518)-N(6)/adenine(1519)-N(6))-dimethyltransferase RsmA [Desulfallas sp. Bu1-1]MBF7084152.1 16S rRNA (adenine(1518)-N(6)/adenine(1519)-N(6))-dimethyltransferase RsmA [Desulfallas sp. Bu1-1]